MKRGDLLALPIVLVVLLGLPAGLFGCQALRTQAAGVRVIDMTSHSPQEVGLTARSQQCATPGQVTARRHGHRHAGVRIAVFRRGAVGVGKVPLEKTVKATFKLSNVGDQPLQILNPPVVEVKQCC
jgi:hypothetical protein